MKNSIEKNILIRTITPSDFTEVLSLWKKAGLSIPNDEMEIFLLQITIKKNPNSCLVLEKDKKIIGNILGTFNGWRGWIYHLAIHPDFQQHGYGSLLLQKTEKELKKQGAQKIHLGVVYTNLKVIQFYEKFGYTVVNDALWLRKSI